MYSPLHLTLLLCFLFSCFFVAAQRWHCADETIDNLYKQSRPGWQQKIDEENQMLREYLRYVQRGTLPRFNSRTAADSVYTISVVVHVVHPPNQPYGTGTNISYAQIRSQIEALNAAFAKTYPTYNGQAHPEYAVDTRIRFCLARNTAPDTIAWATGPGGREPGVRRYADASGASNHSINFTSASQLAKLTHLTSNHFPFSRYLNIWLVQTIGGGNNIMGYAPRPIMADYPLDGVVMRADIFGDNSTGNLFQLPFGLGQGKVLAHEVGHYLNLYHIFQGGCAGTNAAGSANDACDQNGDLICDTEPALTQNIFCTTAPNTCMANYDVGTTQADMIENYMSYADDDCMNTFTLNQAQRMWGTLNLQRQSLWQASNLAATGVLSAAGCVPPFLNANIETDQGVYCVDAPIIFTNPTAGNTAANRQWRFPGSNVAASNSNPVTVQYAAPGTYKAYLTVSDAMLSRTDSLLLVVQDCKLDSSMRYMTHWFFGNFGSVDFRTGRPVQTNTALVNNTMQGEKAYPQQLSAFIGGTVSLSDSSGNLLFYSNGVSVWNRQHRKITSQPMFGMSDINASSGFSYVPYPGQPGKYFVVGAYPNFDERPSGVRFALVDLDKDTVLPYQEFVHPSLPARFSQLMTVVPHCNGTDYWIIAKGFGVNDPKFYSFLVTAAGINATQAPVISTGLHHPGFGGSGNQLKANRQGTALMLMSPHGYIGIETGALYKFDNQTGLVTGERRISDVPGYNNIQGGGAFSPNGDFFYLMRSTDNLNGRPYWLFQYRTSDLAYNVLPAPGFYFASSYQPGPDNQIYITTQENHLNRINNPDQWGGAFVTAPVINLMLLNDRVRPNVSIPNFIDARRPLPTQPEFAVTAVNCSRYRFAAKCFETFTATWDFGDGSPQQTGDVVEHNFARAGTFGVKLTLSSGAKVYGSVTKNVTPLFATAGITGPGFVCTNGQHATQYFSPPVAGVSYHWQVSNGIVSGATNLPFADVLWNDNAKEGNVSLFVNREACSFTLTKTVSIAKGPEIRWSLPDSVCIFDAPVNLTATPESGAYSGRGVTNKIFDPARAGVGNHTITYTYFNETNCPAQLQKTVRVRFCNVPVTASVSCDDQLRNVEVAPNPVTTTLRLKSVYLLNRIQVWNAKGQKVADGRLVGNLLPLPLLASGLYTAVVYCTNGGAFKVLRFLKMP